SGSVAFTESVPVNYDRYLGPMLFEPYANDIVNRVDLREGMRVLEVACGTGIVTRKLRQLLPQSATIVATDLSEHMLDFARRKLSGTAGVEWQQADAMTLRFADESFDLVVCQFGLMFMPDQLAALREMRRVLAPGGELLLNTWDKLEHNDFSHTVHVTQMRFFPADPPMFYETPYSLHDVEQLRSWLQLAGYTQISVRPVNLPVMSASAADAAKGLVQGTPLIVAINERGGDVAAITGAVAEALAHDFGKKPTRGRMSAIVCHATR
ncbi:MAG: methyltransferase domain-containing protein, partial [Verrucomicrobiota bacterium]|nr:methyltransferase domain-containing protein [Verrucomicrobiota bacterium]